MAERITIEAPEVPYPGGTPQPEFMRKVAANLRGGYPVGGSNVTETVASLLDRVADAMETEAIAAAFFEFPAPVEGTATCLACGCSRNINYEQRMNDLVREMRRQLTALERQLERSRS